jgi:phenylacetate-CoA ligase
MERLHGLMRAAHTAFVLGPGRGRVLRYYAWLKTWQRLSEAQKNLERDRLLRDIVRFAYHSVPFYRKLYDAAGVDCDEVLGIAQLHMLPVVTKDMLRSASPSDLRPSRAVKPVAVAASTSGSSGAPVLVYRSLESIMFYGAQLLSYFDAWGLSDRRKVFFMLYNADPTIAVDLPYSSRFSFLNRSHSVDPQLPVEELARRVLEGLPDLVIAHPTTVELFTDHLHDNATVYDKEITFALGGEMLTDRLRGKIERTFPRSTVYDIYNTVETGLTAFQCRQGEGLRVNENAVVIEKGEVVTTSDNREYFRPIFTNLWNRGTPLIRYTGISDLLRTEQSPAGCGFGNTVITEVSGRASELIRSPDTQPCSVCNMMSAHADLPGVRRFQYVQRDPDHLVLRYVASEDADHGDIRRKAAHSVRALLGSRIKFEVQHVERIEYDPRTFKTPMLLRE